MECELCHLPLNYPLNWKSLFSKKPFIENHCCEECFRTFKMIRDNKNICRYCMKEVRVGKNICSDCQYWLEKEGKIESYHRALFNYDEAMQHYFREYKFKGNIKLAKVFSKEIHQGLYYELNERIIVPIPMSQTSFLKRGFNPVEEFLVQAEIPFLKIINKNQETVPQSSKNRAERLQLEQPFVIDYKLKRQVKRRKVIIVDDIYTTGQTIHLAKKCLLENGIRTDFTFSLTR